MEYSSGTLHFKDSNGKQYTVEKTLKATTAHDAVKERNEIIHKEESKGNKYSGGGSAQCHYK